MSILSSWLCSLCFSDPKTIWSLLKFHSPHGLIIICIICIGILKVRLFAKVNASILEYLGNEATIGEHSSGALATCNHMHHIEHHIDIYLENDQFFFIPKIKIPLALTIKNWGIHKKILSTPMHSSYICFLWLKVFKCLDLASIKSFDEFSNKHLKFFIIQTN